MPKAKLEFNLPEEQQQFEDALRGAELKASIEQFYNKSIRCRVKHDNSITIDQKELLDQIQGEFAEILGAMLWEEE